MAGALLHRVRHHRLFGRATKSLIGSVIATIASEIAFAVCYGFGLLGTSGSSVVAFVAGAIPNFILNRSWAWQRRGPVRVWREIVLYVIVSLISLGASVVATGWTAHATHHLSHSARTVLVSGAYLATYAVLFVAKFFVYEYVIFAE